VVASFGLDPSTATIPALRTAFRKRVAEGKLHPDQGGDPVAFAVLLDDRKMAEDYLKLAELDRQVGARARGETVEAPRKRRRLTKDEIAAKAQTLERRVGEAEAAGVQGAQKPKRNARKRTPKATQEASEG
jgi:hypothetical protein